MNIQYPAALTEICYIKDQKIQTQGLILTILPVDKSRHGMVKQAARDPITNIHHVGYLAQNFPHQRFFLFFTSFPFFSHLDNVMSSRHLMSDFSQGPPLPAQLLCLSTAPLEVCHHGVPHDTSQSTSLLFHALQMVSVTAASITDGSQE